MFKIAISLFALILFSSCSSDSQIIDSLQTELLVNCWTHSMEEDPNNVTQIYRPCLSREFPESRFRMFMDLKSDGSCEYLELSPVDAHQAVEGSWIFDESTDQLSILNQKGSPVFESKIIDISADKISFEQS